MKQFPLFDYDTVREAAAILRAWGNHSVRVTELPGNLLLTSTEIDDTVWKYLGTPEEDEVFEWLSKMTGLNHLVYQSEDKRCTITVPLNPQGLREMFRAMAAEVDRTSDVGPSAQ